MKTLNKIKNWITSYELYKTLSNQNILYLLTATFLYILLLADMTINSINIGEYISTLIIIPVSSTFAYLSSTSKSNDKSLFFAYLKEHSKLIQILIVITFFEILYIYSYSPKMMIPENIMELILISLPAFKFCVFIYVFTIERVANEKHNDITE